MIADFPNSEIAKCRRNRDYPSRMKTLRNPTQASCHAIPDHEGKYANRPVQLIAGPSHFRATPTVATRSGAGDAGRRASRVPSLPFSGSNQVKLDGRSICICTMRTLALLALFATALSFTSCSSARVRAEAEQAALIASVSAYKAKYGTYPRGKNEHILNELQGKRPGTLVFIELPPRAVDSSGNFLDPWGRAYIFEFPSSNAAVVRSAGKDRIYLTSDDLVRTDKK